MNIIDSSKDQNKIRKKKRKENKIFEKEKRKENNILEREQRELDRDIGDSTKLERLKKTNIPKKPTTTTTATFTTTEIATATAIAIAIAIAIIAGTTVFYENEKMKIKN